MRLVVVEDIAALSRHRDAWSELLADSGQNEVTVTPFWIETWWAVFGGTGQRRLRAGLVFDGDRLAGVAPLLSRPTRRQLIPYRTLELLASGEDELDEICSDYIGPIARRGAENQVAAILVAGLDDGAFGAWDEVLFPCMAGDGPLPRLLCAELSRRGHATDLCHTTVSPTIDLPSTWEAYLEMLPGRHRYDLRKAVRGFEAWAGETAALKIATSEAELARGLAILQQLHEQRWDGSGLFRSVRFTDFHHRVMPELLARDALELIWLEVRGEPVAILYNLVWDGRVSFYQSGRTRDVPKNVKVGKAMHAYAIQRSIRLGRRVYDFLAGEAEYKRQMATSERPLVSLRAARVTPRELTRGLVEIARDHIRIRRKPV